MNAESFIHHSSLPFAPAIVSNDLLGCTRSDNANSTKRQRGCLRQRAAERRQSLAPGERVPMYRDERNPGITFTLQSSAGFSRRRTWRVANRSVVYCAPSGRGKII